MAPALQEQPESQRLWTEALVQDCLSASASCPLHADLGSGLACTQHSRLTDALMKGMADGGLQQAHDDC